MHARISVLRVPGQQSAGWLRRSEDDSSTTHQMPNSANAGTGMLRHDLGESDSWADMLDRYLEGWAEVNPTKIFAATTHGYRFDDPLVGRFSRWSIPTYFERLQGRFAPSGASATRDFAFFVHGPMDGPLRRGQLKFFREAPRLGLAGVTCITLGEQGVLAETVAYDLNLALDVLGARSAKAD
jgi:hypothetical protein